MSTSFAPLRRPILLVTIATLSACTLPPSGEGTTPIPRIQGAGHESLLVGESVRTRGVVTLRADEGFFLQDREGDGDPATSDALFVAAGGESPVAGTLVTVEGRVEEIRGRDTDLPLTTLVDVSILLERADVELPEPVVLGRDGRAIPTSVIDDDGLTRFEPTTDGIDFYESLEGMLVRVNDAVAVSPASRFGEIWVLADGGANATVLNARGGITISENDFNPERIQVEDALYGGPAPQVRIGDRLGDLVGPLSYGYGSYELLALERPQVESVEVTQDATALDGFTIATFNVLNLAADEPDRFPRTADVIVRELGAPAIVGLQEMQDDDGAAKSGDTSADRTFELLIEAIVAGGGPRYAYTQIDPVDGADGGEPGGNIRVGYLYDPARVGFEPRGDGGPLDPVGVTSENGEPRLTLNPGRVDPTHPSFDRSRKPLAAEFTVGDETLFVINVHLSSKGGSTPLFGAVQPPVNAREEERTQQAGRVRALVEAIVAIDPEAHVVVLGDFNEFQFNPALLELTRGGLLRETILDLEPAERWTYVFEGNSQDLDHVLVSPGFTNTQVDVVHGHAGVADGVSDHDPVVVRLEF